MSHYFENSANLKSAEAEAEYIYKRTRLKFITDAGVFAKGGVDGATRILLESLPEIKSGARVLDLGCGYGPVGVALSKVCGADVVMSDVNERALGLARRNLELNGASASVIKSDGFENITGLFDCIILNPPVHAGKPVIYKLYQGARDYINHGGGFYTVIRKKHGAPSHRRKLEEIFGGVSVLHAKKGVLVLRATC